MKDKKTVTWRSALVQFNKENKKRGCADTFVIPKKGTKEYNRVKAIQTGAK